MPIMPSGKTITTTYSRKRSRPDSSIPTSPPKKAKRSVQAQESEPESELDVQQNSLPTDLPLWVRNFFLETLERTSEQILTLFTEIRPSEWLIFYESPDLLETRTGWCSLQSMFTDVKSRLDARPLIAHQASSDDASMEQKTLALINLTSALSILTKKSPNYDELKAVSDEFSDLFAVDSGPLLDWQIRLGLDIKQETWRVGVRENVFSKAEGLINIFSSSSSTNSEDELNKKLDERRKSLEKSAERALPQQLCFGPLYGRELISLALRYLRTLRAAQNTNPDLPEDEASVDGYARDSSQPAMSGSGSMREQYERAKLAAAEKAAARNKGVPIQPSQRRPWSDEETNALMEGLDKVQGPHWSQILPMYGPGGSISEVLKDRNQVQLKDKARNLKLLFLKGGHEVPHHLEKVTGELKTRAPRAARNDSGVMEDIYSNEISSPRPNIYFSTSSQFYSQSSDNKDAGTDQVAPEEDGAHSREDEGLTHAIQAALQAIHVKNGPQAVTNGTENAEPDDSG